MTAPVLALALSVMTVSAGQAETRQHIAGPEYGKSALHTFWWGEGYREVWTTPIEVELLDLRKEAGGLEVVTQVGGMQTPGLALKGADGKAYTFRSVKKDLTRILPKQWQKTILAENIQDQNTANHPGVYPFLDGLPEPFPWAAQPPQRLVLMPDDPALGEYRELFAGRLGTFGEYPMPAEKGRPGFMGATEILSSQELWRRWLEGPENRVDTKMFLRYRIADIWTGNWDRHSKQWRWARLPGKDRWRPIAEDPDQVFADYGGPLLWLARWQFPKLVAFEDRISGMEGVTFNGADIDRWVLTDLDREAFLQAAREMQAELTDEVIERAMKNQPPEWYAVNGEELAEKLKRRRDGLEEAVERYYRYLAGEVNVHGTDRDEVARIRRSEEGDVEVTIALAGEDAQPYYRRRFKAGETRSVRLYLYGGSDRVVSEGPPGGRVKVIVIGGPGDDTLDDSLSGGTKFYDFEGRNEVTEGKGTRVDTRPWKNPSPSEVNPWIEPRDHGRWTRPDAYLWYEPDLGVLVNAGFRRTTWSFRKVPFDSNHRFMVRYSTARRRGGFDLGSTFTGTNSPFSASLDLAYSGIESLNYFGFGNETVRNEELDERDFYQVEENFFRLNPAVDWNSAVGAKVSFGLDLQYTEETSSDTLIDETKPYGSGRFGQLGLLLGLDWSSRGNDDRSALTIPKAGNLLRASQTGIGFEVEGSYFPPVVDVEENFGALEGEVTGSLGLGASERIVIAGRIGGRAVWGDFPWREAAFIGGKDSNRGFSSRRFAGDKSAYGSLELRLHLLNSRKRLPSKVWIYGLVDVGRVWVDGEDSEEWHPSYGGGIVMELMGTPVRLRAEVARNDDEDSQNFYLLTGFSF
jgi:hypothetical protein